MSRINTLSISIQAGGQSRRMGQDKGLLPFQGQPLVWHIVERMRPEADELVVITNRLEEYSFLDVPLFPDLLPGRGALGGLYTALTSASHPLVGVVACDMPFASLPLLAALRDLLVDSDWDVAIPATVQGIEPFHAVYRRATCLPPIEAAIQADQWRVDSWFPDVRLRFFSPEETLPYDPSQLAFWNMNTPEDYQHALQLVNQLWK